jgi:hypothetical protein
MPKTSPITKGFLAANSQIYEAVKKTLYVDFVIEALYLNLLGTGREVCIRRSCLLVLPSKLAHFG